MTLFPTRTKKGRGAALLGGIGIGATLMYLLDPGRGRRRRALIRDKAVRFGRVAGERLGARSRDLRNRARGLAARMQPGTAKEPPAGDVPGAHESVSEVSELHGSSGPRRDADREQGRFESENE